MSSPEVGNVEVLVEDYIFTAMLFLSALCLSTVGVIVIYYSIQEDQVVRYYEEEGIDVKADILSTEAVLGRRIMDADRGCGDEEGGLCPQEPTEGDLEYIAVAQYKYKYDAHQESYSATIIKQVRALGEDFLVRKESKNANLHTDFVDLSDIHMSPDEVQLSESGSREMDLVILPSFPRSGIPRHQLERALRLGYRLPTYAFSLSMIGFSLLLAFWGTRNAPIFGGSHGQAAGYAALVLGGLVLVEAVLTRVFLHDWMTKSLHDEYFGEDVSMLQVEDSIFSISTKGSLAGWGSP